MRYRHGNRLIEALYRFIEAICVLSFTFYTAVLIVQVFLRYATPYSLHWSEEAIRMMFVWNIMLGAALVTARNHHVRIELFEMWAPPAVARVVSYVNRGLQLLFYGIVFYFSVEHVRHSAIQISPLLHVSMAYFYGAILVGSGLCAFFAAVTIVSPTSEEEKPHEP